MITRNAYTQGKGELAWDTWPNCLVLRLSLQSRNEINDPLKSGPAKARPAGPATLPLHMVQSVDFGGQDDVAMETPSDVLLP